MHRAAGAVAGEVQKDAVVLWLRVQRLQDVVHHVIQTGQRTGAGAQAPGQHSWGRGGAGPQWGRAGRVLAWGGLWQDTGMVWLDRMGTFFAWLDVLDGGQGVWVNKMKTLLNTLNPLFTSWYKRVSTIMTVLKSWESHLKCICAARQTQKSFFPLTCASSRGCGRWRVFDQAGGAAGFSRTGRGFD